MGQNALIWNLIANRYAKTPIVNKEAYQQKLELTRQHLQTDSTLFEFGCGTGSTALAHASFVKNILAIDISYKMLNIAKSNAREKGISNIEFLQDSIENFPEEKNSFDAILGMSILHILPDRESVLQKINSLLSTNGVFISSTVCMNSISIGWKIFVKVAAFLRLLPPISFLSEDELVEDIQNAGFDIEYKWRPTEKEAVFIIARKAN